MRRRWEQRTDRRSAAGSRLEPASDRTRWRVIVDEAAPPGDVIPALARLLLALVRREANGTESRNDTDQP
jgi:hypothetical protein